MTDVKGIKGEITLDGTTQLKSWLDLHFGLFIHLGLYSELGGVWKDEPVKVGYSEQIQMWGNISHEDYAEVAKDFTLEKFDAEEIVSLAKNAGMKYLVITSKHHDGFCLFDTKTTDYNVVKRSPFGRDVLKLLSDECKKQGIKFGLYYSLVDWNEGHDFDHNNNNTIPKSMEPLIEEQLTELMTNYGNIAEVWFDMSHPTKEQSDKFSAIVRKYQPEAGINGRIWNNKGDFRTLDDNQVPTEQLDGPWQTPASIYRETWGYRKWQEREDFDAKVQNLLETLISIRARGGNYLLNIGPKGDGTLVDFEADVLKKMGEWIQRHPDAVVGSHPTRFDKPAWGEITTQKDTLYLHVFTLPENNELVLDGLVTEVKQVSEDGYGKELAWKKEGTELKITLPEKLSDPHLTTIKVELVDELRITPHILVTSENNEWLITPDKIDKGFNFVDQGNYTSLEKSNIRQSGYIKAQSKGTFTLEFKGETQKDLNYRVELGSEKLVVTGKQLKTSEIGPFTLEESTDHIPFTLALHEPENRYQDLGLKTESIRIKKIK